jgi:hypothetical protein
MVEQTRLLPNTINRRLAAMQSLVKATAALGSLPKARAYEFSLIEKVQRAALRHRLTPHRRLFVSLVSDVGESLSPGFRTWETVPPEVL